MGTVFLNDPAKESARLKKMKHKHRNTSKKTSFHCFFFMRALLGIFEEISFKRDSIFTWAMISGIRIRLPAPNSSSENTPEGLRLR
jgi:hypothetical protein